MPGEKTTVDQDGLHAALAALETAIEAALRDGDESGLSVLGYGEVNPVVAAPPDAPRWACKRLPPFPSAERMERYREVIAAYIEELRAHGIPVVPTAFHTLTDTPAGFVLYVVQPVFPAEVLGVAVFRASEPSPDHPLLRAVMRAFASIDERVGLDGQLSNWVWSGGDAYQLDVTTPFLRDDAGRPRLDVDLLVQSLPAPLRPVVKRFVAPGILTRYHEPRVVVLDFAGNLCKERLEDWVPAALEASAAAGIDRVSLDDVHRYYASDRRTWAAMLAVRRANRWWYRRVRRRTYPFLLPGRIER